MECKLEKLTVYYEQRGEGRPILFLHGWPADHRSMVNDFEPLFEKREGWRRIYPDMPGMGKTRGAAWITNQDQMLDVLLQFIDAMIPGQRFCLAGMSYGGYLAQGVIYKRAAMVDGALFLVPAMGLARQERTLPEQVTLKEDEALLAELAPEEAALFRQTAVVQSRALLDSLKEDIVPARRAADFKFLEKVYEQYQFSFDVTRLPQPFEAPSLFLMGRHDTSVGYRDAWEVMEQYPRASFVVLDRAGHFLAREQKALFLALADEWLARVEEEQRRP